MFYDKDINEVLSYLNASTKEDILVSQCCEVRSTLLENQSALAIDMFPENVEQRSPQLEIQKKHEIQEHEKTDLEETPVLTGKCHIMLKVMVFN